MPKIKLSEWAERNNLSYITANRHFHAGLIPGAVQLDSGTILVEDNTAEQTMATTTSANDAMSLFLKKTVEFSKANASVEDFAAYVISNFQLKLNTASYEGPRYSKNKPKPEEVQKHFQQFIPDKEKQEHLKAVKDLLEKTGSPATKIQEPNPFARVVDTVSDEGDTDATLMSQILAAAAPEISDVHLYGEPTTTDGLVTRSVDCNTTPQQINYTGSTSQTFSGPSSVFTNSVVPTASMASFSGDVGGTFASSNLSDMFEANGVINSVYVASHPVAAGTPFQPTKKELLSAVKVIETAETEDAPRKRGRKPTLKR